MASGDGDPAGQMPGDEWAHYHDPCTWRLELGENE